MSTTHSFRMFFVAAALLPVMAAGASAQSVNGEPDHRVDVERAARLETEANALFNEPTEYDKAARKLREAAQLRPREDRQAIMSLHLAASLAYHAKDFGAARAAMLDQAERALNIGEVGVAAHALINAALAAKELNDVAAFDYVARARLLATSTLLPAMDRASIAKRIGDEPITSAEGGASGL